MGEGYRFQPPHNFLGLDAQESDPDRSRVWILPVPYEVTTSYGCGTKLGPDAILAASRQVELYDQELGEEAALRWGIHTLPALDLDLSSPQAALDEIAAAVAGLAAADRLLVVLGGEHTVSAGVARGLRRVFGEFLTVQLDAHADLRDTFSGTPYSHACTARRIVELGGPLIQVGIRSFDVSDAEFIREHPQQVTTFTAEQVLGDPGFPDRLAGLVRGRPVYLTVDVDAFDPSIMPATGTPEPGGLGWYDVLRIVKAVIESAEVLAFDCVELAPIPGLHAPDFMAARLVYKMINYVMAGREGRASS